MKSGSSASISSHGESVVMAGSAISSWYQKSRPSNHSTCRPVCFTTMQVVMLGHEAIASSAAALRGTLFEPRRPPSAVIMMVESQSKMRSRRESAEKPPNTTLWMAPIRAQASMAMGSSGIIGR